MASTSTEPETAPCRSHGCINSSVSATASPTAGSRSNSRTAAPRRTASRSADSGRCRPVGAQVQGEKGWRDVAQGILGRRPARTEILVFGFLLYLLIIGIVAGFLARLLVPGRDPMGIGATILLGIIGSFIGGFLGWALFGTDLEDGALQASGVLGSIVGAVIALLIYRAISHRSRRDVVHH